MLASRLPTILPPLRDESGSGSGKFPRTSQNLADYFRRPFRSPHHTSSAVALVGGGANLNLAKSPWPIGACYFR